MKQYTLMYLYHILFRIVHFKYKKLYYLLTFIQQMYEHLHYVFWTFPNIGTLVHLVEIGPFEAADLNITHKLYRTLRNSEQWKTTFLIIARLTPPTIQKHTPHIKFLFFGWTAHCYTFVWWPRAHQRHSSVETPEEQRLLTE